MSLEPPRIARSFDDFCPKCKGRGAFRAGSTPRWEIGEWIMCPVCKGTGTVEGAMAQADWPEVLAKIMSGEITMDDP